MGSYKLVITKITILLTLIRGLITPLITTHEPPSMEGHKTREERWKTSGCHRMMVYDACWLKAPFPHPGPYPRTGKGAWDGAETGARRTKNPCHKSR